MDSLLKLVYTNWEGDDPVANGDGRSCFILGTFHDSYRSYAVKDIQDNDSIYVYPIEITAATLSVLLDTTFIESLSNVLENLKIGRLKLLINLVHDPVLLDSKLLTSVETVLNEIGIDSKNIIFFFGNEYPAETKLQMCCGLQGLVYQARDLCSYPYTAAGYTSDCLRVSDLDNTVLRPKKFLSPNNTMRAHRVFLAYTVVENNMLDDGLFSFIEARTSLDISELMKYYTGSADDNVCQKLAKLLPYELDTKGLTPAERRAIIGLPGNVKQWYEDSYIHIVTETMFTDLSECFISEKVFRPIINLQPFLLFGDYGSLRKLKELGFKTFSPFIDESYDMEQDHGKRLLMLRKELLKLNSMPLQEIHDWYYSITDILIHNQTHLASFANKNFFADGIEKIYRYYKHE
jgi:hypothetical protein